jgi:hypothetical protein
MPFLDAKALETDPDGLAFLRAVLKPAAQRAPSDPHGAAPAESRPPFIPACPPQGEMPLAMSREAPAAPAS